MALLIAAPFEFFFAHPPRLGQSAAYLTPDIQPCALVQFAGVRTLDYLVTSFILISTDFFEMNSSCVGDYYHLPTIYQDKYPGVSCR